MSGKLINYYAGGNTAQGFYDLFESNLQGLERIYLLTGDAGTGKSSIIKKLAGTWNHYDLELIHSSLDSESLDGLIIPALKCAIIDGTVLSCFKPKAPGALEHHINLEVALDTELLANERQTILSLQKQKQDILELAYQAFQKGLSIHDDLEAIYINQMDFTKANNVTHALVDKIFIGIQSDTEKGTTRHRFFGASTPQGTHDFIANITGGLSKRYFIKGRAGTGKSTLLKKVATAALERNFSVEMYHCGFDPDSIDMVVIRELGVCVFDSTDPHEYFPNQHGDEIIDIYQTAVVPGTDEKFKNQINDVTKRYKLRMKEGISYLQEAKNIQDQVKDIYKTATDFSVVDRIYEDLNDAIEKLE